MPLAKYKPLVTVTAVLRQKAADFGDESSDICTVLERAGYEVQFVTVVDGVTKNALDLGCAEEDE